MAATIEPPSIQVEPGGTATAQIRIVNLSRVVDEFRVEMLGEGAAWTTAQPASISLFPGATGTIDLQIRPPRTVQARAGTVPLQVTVRSMADPYKAVSVPALIRVGAFEAITVGLVPRTSTGSRGGTHELTVENQGNSLVQLNISASDPDRKLDFGVPGYAIALEAAQRVVVPIKVRPLRTFLRGNPVTMPFQVVVDPFGGTRATADASFAQQQILPSWTGRALAALVTLGVAAVVAVVAIPLAGRGGATPTPPTGGIGGATASAPAVTPGTATATPKRQPTKKPVATTPAEPVTPSPTATATETIEITPSPSPSPTLVPLACDGRAAEALTLTLMTGRASYTVPEGTLACLGPIAFVRPPSAIDREFGAIQVISNNGYRAVTDATTIFDGGAAQVAGPVDVPAGQQILWQSDCSCPGYFAALQLVLLPGDGRAPAGINGARSLLEASFQNDMDGNDAAADLVLDGGQLTSPKGPLLKVDNSPGGYADCWARLRLADSVSDPVAVADLVDGNHLCLRTDEGRVVSATFVGGEHPTLEFITYEP